MNIHVLLITATKKSQDLDNAVYYIVNYVFIDWKYKISNVSIEIILTERSNRPDNNTSDMLALCERLILMFFGTTA